MVDKRPIGYIPGKGNPLDKKVPKSKKYEYVTSTLSTGSTIKDINIMSDQALAKRRNELFKRVKTSTLSNLIRVTQGQLISLLIFVISNIVQQEKNFESIYNLTEENREQMGDAQSVRSQKSVPVSVASQASQISAITYATDRLGITDDTIFLLIDLREPEDYLQYHIREAINYPAPNVSRDKFLPAIYRFKNKTDKLIIIYHSDERNGIPVATKFVEKGFENVYLLNGGIEKFLIEFPEEVEGSNVPHTKENETKSQASMNMKSINNSQIQQSNQKRAYSQVKESANLSQKGGSVSGLSKIGGQSITKPKLGEQSTYHERLVGQGSSTLSRAGGQIVGGSIQQSTKLVKRSNYKEYPINGDIQIQKDLKEEQEIQRIINNSAIKQNYSQMSGVPNDFDFQVESSYHKK